jgi:cyclophilin family peptidyl-prolyl cis-trans isomerase
MRWIKRFRSFFVSASAKPESVRRKPRVEVLEDRTTPTAVGSITGNVFFDFNNNNVKDTNEPNLPGFTIRLSGTTIGGAAVHATSFTDVNGKFAFNNLEGGTYSVDATQTFFTAPNPKLGTQGGTVQGPKITDITLAQGQSATGLSFAAKSLNGATIGSQLSLRSYLNTAKAAPSILGSPGTGVNTVNNQIPTTPPTGSGSLAGIVFNDANVSGTQDGGETGVAGVTVYLTGATSANVPVNKTATTDANGAYSFGSLPAGTFFINVVPKSGFRSTGSVVGSLGGTALRTDQIAPTVLTTASAGTGYNFGIVAIPTGLQANVADNNLADDTTGTFGIVTQDQSITGKVSSVSDLKALEATFQGTTGFTSILDTVNKADGTFFLSADRVTRINGGSMPTGDYTLTIRATNKAGAQTTVNVAFHFVSNGPIFLSALPNVSVAHSTTSNVLLAGTFTDPATTDSTVDIDFINGSTESHVHVELFDKTAPRTVSNFFQYIQRYQSLGGAVVNRAFNLSGLQGVQMGGDFFTNATNTITPYDASTNQPAIRNEFSDDRPNVRGTLAMAKGSDPDSATGEFFFNLSDQNAQTLNVNNTGGFSVFGKVSNPADLAILDQMLNTPPANQLNANSLGFVPATGSSLNRNNLYFINSITFNRDNQLTYSFTSSNTSIATVADGATAFQGDVVAITGVAPGTSTITVTATDKAGNSASTSFVVTIT